MNTADLELVEGIRKGELKAYEELYKLYYVYLCLLAGHITGNRSEAEEIVSDVFFKIWKNRQIIEINISLKGYLARSVRNTALNYLELRSSEKMTTGSLSESDHQLVAWASDYPLGNLYEQEVRDLLEKGIESLPPACREIFLLSRNEDLKYSEIAQKLGISVNTVKTQLSIALKRLRESLKEYLPLLLFLSIL
jgi:RNA polymerase sigma-70 factor (ECF subfamily)